MYVLPAADYDICRQELVGNSTLYSPRSTPDLIANNHAGFLHFEMSGHILVD
jgi:hypothetical protein